jgi:hypothetical protein
MGSYGFWNRLLTKGSIYAETQNRFCLGPWRIKLLLPNKSTKLGMRNTYWMISLDMKDMEEL